MKIIKKIFLSFSLIITACALFVSCNEQTEPGKDPGTNETPEVIDYVANTKLGVSVTESSNFFGEDGVGLATLVRCVDGDTALFITNGKEFTARFLGVDTPESTGQIEEWGKTASKFTADKLNNAVSIIVQSNGGPAELDTTGDRYLTYVWYKPSKDSDYRLLNLELVQEGLSYGKSATASKYAEQLVAAQSQAMNQKKHIFGNEQDPNYYYGDALEVSIKYVIENQEELIAGNMKVKFDCVITRVDGLYVYAQDYDAETNQVYSILLYKGYSLTTKKLEVGNKVSVCGNVTLYDNQVQVTNMKDIKYVTSLDNIQLLDTNQEVLCSDVTVEELKSNNPALARRLVKLENLVVKSLWTTQQGDSMGAITITGTVNGETVTVRTSVLYNENYDLITEDYFKGHTITVIGIIETYQGSYQVRVVSINDVTIVE